MGSVCGFGVLQYIVAKGSPNELPKKVLTMDSTACVFLQYTCVSDYRGVAVYRIRKRQLWPVVPRKSHGLYWISPGGERLEFGTGLFENRVYLNV